MKTKRRVEIEIETLRLTIRRHNSPRHFLPCAPCAAEVEVVAAEQAALICGCSLRRFINQLETSSLHFIETDDGLLYICLNSLQNAIERRPAISLTGHLCDTEAISGDPIESLKE